MGLLKDFRNWKVSSSLADNGLSEGSGSEVCEKCRNRVQDTRSSYLVCAQHRIHVGADQVCQLFEYGDPVYVMS